MRISGIILGLLFGLLFAGGGLFIALETIWPTYQSWQAMKQWQPTKATLLSLRGSDNDTIARYRYRINERDYENNRVYVAPFKDNIGSYHKEKFNELNRLKKDQQPVTIWYNTNNPVVLFRSLSITHKSQRTGDDPSRA